MGIRDRRAGADADGASGLFAASSTLVDLTIEAFAKLPYTLLGLMLLKQGQEGGGLWSVTVLGLVLVLLPPFAFVLFQARVAVWVERRRRRSR